MSNIPQRSQQSSNSHTDGRGTTETGPWDRTGFLVGVRRRNDLGKPDTRKRDDSMLGRGRREGEGQEREGAAPA